MPSPEQKPKGGAVNPGNKFWREFYAPCAWDLALLYRIKRCSSCRPFEVPEKTSFADLLSELRIGVMNVKDVALVPLDDSTMQVAVKASIYDQFATLAASIFAGRNRSAIPFSSVGELLDSLGDLTMNHTPAAAATRLGSRKAAGGVAAADSAHRGSMFTVVGQEKKWKLDDAWHWKYEDN